MENHRGGFLWLNTSYDSTSGDDSEPVMSLKRLYYNAEFVCTLLSTQNKLHKDRLFRLLAMGKKAQFVASLIKGRLDCHNIKCALLHDMDNQCNSLVLPTTRI